jgi:hypothetical protein
MPAPDGHQELGLLVMTQGDESAGRWLTLRRHAYEHAVTHHGLLHEMPT